MTREQLAHLSQVLGMVVGAHMPEGAKFFLVIAKNAPPGGDVTVHTATSTDMTARDVKTVLSSVLHAVEVNPEALGAGQIVDMTPTGPAS